MEPTTITGVHARKIFDGAGQVTIELDVRTAEGGAVSSPSFAHKRTRGKYEVIHYPEGGVDEALEILTREIVPRLMSQDVRDQVAIDRLLHAIDGTPNFARIGGNTAEVVSTTVAKAAAATLGVPLFHYLGGTFATRLPHLLINIIGGGPTAGGEGWRGRGPDIQEHNLIPVGFSTILTAMQGAVEVHAMVGEMLRDADPHYTGGRDYEYSWIPALTDVACLDILTRACENVGKGKTGRFRLGLDFAASDLWRGGEGVYVYAREGVTRTPTEQARFVRDLIEQYNLFYVEDPFHEDDLAAYVDLSRDYGSRCLIVGDDLYGTDPARLQTGVAARATNAAVVKVNMIATITETQQFVEIARAHRIAMVLSPRTCDTPDTTLADLAVGWGTSLLKTGGALGGERIAKVNELIRIEEQLGMRASLAPFPDVQP